MATTMCDLCREPFQPTDVENVYCPTCQDDQARLAEEREADRELEWAEASAAWHLAHNGSVGAAA